MSRAQLAHEIGVAPEMLAAWEDGDVPVGCPHAIEQILGHAEVSPRRLFASGWSDEGTIAAG